MPNNKIDEYRLADTIHSAHAAGGSDQQCKELHLYHTQTGAAWQYLYCCTLFFLFALIISCCLLFLVA